MTKPECSKTETAESKEKEQSLPTTAKDLFADFVPEEQSSDSDAEQKINDEPKRKRSRNGNPTKKHYLQKYKKEWESKPELKSWLSESVHGNTYFYCKFCKKDYRCSISDIHKHASSKTHSLKATMPSFQAHKFKFRGLLCPVFTPFTTSNRITPDVAFKSIPKYANFLAACGVTGILVNDVVGEGMALTVRERMDVLDSWVTACSKTNQFLMVQVGGAPLKDVIELAKHAKTKEVGAIVILPDLYNKPQNHLDIIRYIKFITDYVKDIPILYHHDPEKSGIQINISEFLLDITGEIDSFVGLIITTNDLKLATSALTVNREKFTVFIGTDEVILGAVASGFSCIMTSVLNFLPKLVQSIYEDGKHGNLKDAQKGQNLLNKSLGVILAENSGVAGLKAATELITSTCSSITRKPIHLLYESRIKKIQETLREMGVI